MYTSCHYHLNIVDYNLNTCIILIVTLCIKVKKVLHYVHGAPCDTDFLVKLLLYLLSIYVDA